MRWWISKALPINGAKLGCLQIGKQTHKKMLKSFFIGHFFCSRIRNITYLSLVVYVHSISFVSQTTDMRINWDMNRVKCLINPAAKSENKCELRILWSVLACTMHSAYAHSHTHNVYNLSHLMWMGKKAQKSVRSGTLSTLFKYTKKLPQENAYNAIIWHVHCFWYLFLGHCILCVHFGYVPFAFFCVFYWFIFWLI